MKPVILNPREPEGATVDPKTARLPAEVHSLKLDGHEIDVALAYDKGVLHEIQFVGRGKIGQGVDLLLHDLGVQLSRAIQGRDPVTGA